MPALATSVINTPLTAFVSGYTPGNFIADKLCPVIEHDKTSGTYFSKSKADIVTEYEDLMGPETEASIVDYSTSKTDFTLVARGLGAYIPYAKLDAASDPLDVEQGYAKTVMNALLLKHERRVATVLLTTTSYVAANRLTATAPWNNPTTGVPVDDFHRARALLAPGDADTTKVVGGMGLEAYLALSRSPQLLGLRAGGGTKDGVLSQEEVAQKLGLDELWVSDVQYATSARGATLATSRVWDTTKAVVLRVPKSTPSYEQAQSLFACSFRWSSPSQAPFEAVEWEVPSRGPGKGSKAVKISHWTLAGAVIQNDMGVILSTVTS